MVEEKRDNGDVAQLVALTKNNNTVPPGFPGMAFMCILYRGDMLSFSPATSNMLGK